MKFSEIIDSKLKEYGGAGKITTESQKWFNDSYATAVPLKEPEEFIWTNFFPGKIHVFIYAAVDKTEPDFWDKYPMVFSLGSYTNPKTKIAYERGVNLHYMPPQYRLQFLSAVWEFYKNIIESNQALIEKGLFKSQYQIDFDSSFKSFSNFASATKFTKAIVSYNLNFLQSRPNIISYDDWFRIPFLVPNDIKSNTIANIWKEFLSEE